MTGLLIESVTYRSSCASRSSGSKSKQSQYGVARECDEEADEYEPQNLLSHGVPSFGVGGTWRVSCKMCSRREKVMNVVHTYVGRTINNPAIYKGVLGRG